ncbi:M48 family metallopeptidase [Neorhizobium galegae]|uniref:M48 family metallopeptidase n=1 Tax=Neorhizobium galegae TaxID=399 RepID=A0A6A1TQF5_NEOGA|nr:SprT family zinc-dependent metalloprotease [Neorhizobium galegae]KAB1085077.1 M48 family metallopeptidase [Neorhizobium galegae]
MVTELDIGGISVDVVFKDIKNVHLSVYPPTGRVRISAPSRMSLENIRLFAIAKLGWIKNQQTKLQRQDRESPREFIERESHYLWGQRYLLQIAENGDSIGVEADYRRIILHVEADASRQRRQAIIDEWYRRELKQAAKPLIAKWETQLEERVDRFFVQRMKTKWGSSNPRLKTIRLNLELAKKHPECLDYVIIHEIMHFLVPDHGTRFVQMMDQNMPNWRLVRQRLNEAPLVQDSVEPSLNDRKLQ